MFDLLPLTIPIFLFVPNTVEKVLFVLYGILINYKLVTIKITNNKKTELMAEKCSSKN